MTPAINTAKIANITYKIHEYSHDASHDSYGVEAATKLNVSKERIFKTLVVKLDEKTLAVGVIPVSSMLSLKRIAKAAGAKKAAMATPADVERTTGYVLGGVSPLGQKKPLKTFVDCSAQHHSTLFVSAGRRGLEIELGPQDLINLTRADVVILCQ